MFSYGENERRARHYDVSVLSRNHISHIKFYTKMSSVLVSHEFLYFSIILPDIYRKWRRKNCELHCDLQRRTHTYNNIQEHHNSIFILNNSRYYLLLHIGY